MTFTEDLIGVKFGRWEIVGKVHDKESYNSFRVHCLCSCGTKRDVLYRSLRTGRSKSCGCYNREQSKEKLMKIISEGTVFGRWTVVSEAPISRKATTYYRCRCSCGIEREVDRYSLVKGRSFSCGCLQSKGEFLISSFLSNNNVSFETQFSFSDCLSPKGRRLKFDFFVSNKLLIEFQGSQHFKLNPKKGRFKQSEEKFEQTLLYDKIKKEYIESKGIPCLYISYSQIKEIESILLEALLFYDII